jgi:hypothetical protein
LVAGLMNLDRVETVIPVEVLGHVGKLAAATIRKQKDLWKEISYRDAIESWTTSLRDRTTHGKNGAMAERPRSTPEQICTRAKKA